MGVQYGTGSGQQVVTCHRENKDLGGMWTIKERDTNPLCETGQPIKCGSTIRLEHIETGKNLHSHGMPSPLSRRNEISGYGDDGDGDTGDNWMIECYDTVTGLIKKSDDLIYGNTTV